MKQFTHLKCAIQWFLVYSRNRATTTTIQQQNIHHPPKKPHGKEIILYIVLCDTLLSLSIMFLRFIHILFIHF